MFPHLVMLEFNGLLEECAIMKEDKNTGDIYYIKIANLDGIDKNRLRTILSKRDAGKRPLWDVMQDVTLPNGQNALEYFHQLVKGRTQTGEVFIPRPGRMGAAQARRRVQQQRAKAVEATKAKSSVKAKQKPEADTQTE